MPGKNQIYVLIIKNYKKDNQQLQASFFTTYLWGNILKTQFQ